MPLRKKVAALVIEYRTAGRMSEDIADAAIDAVFDHLMEPSEGMLEAAEDVRMNLLGEHNGNQGVINDNSVATLQAMLTQARKEASE
jgi:hypothetical protein